MVADKPAETPQRTFPWMKSTLEWGTRARPNKGGLTIGALNIGLYGEIPDEWHDETRMPRGAFPLSGIPAVGGYSQKHKVHQWADCAAELYEEAISRRWVPALEVPWRDAPVLPEDQEIALAQVCTELSQQASVEMEVLSRWLQELSYGYHEVKLFLATEVYESGRHFEMFRKRALVNGGGLQLESSGQMNRQLLESRVGWTETVVFLHILRGTFTQTLYRFLAAHAPTPADRVLFSLAMQDKARHLAYGMQHVRYAVAHRQDFGEQMQRFLISPELAMATEGRDPVLWEALAIVFGGGVRHMDEGMETVRQLKRHFVQDYLRRLRYIGVNREARIFPELGKWLTAEPVATAV
jgi:hypothetical protein